MFFASDVFKDFTAERVLPTPEQFKEALKPIEAKSDLLLPHYQQFIESSAATRGSQANQKYRAVKTHLENFELKQKKKLKFDQININFFNAFTTYAMSKDLNHTNNTNEAEDYKEHVNTNSMNTTLEITDWFINAYPKKFTNNWEYEKMRDEIAPQLFADSTLKERVVNEIKVVSQDTTVPAILWIQGQLLQPNNFENGMPF
jgi:hypothetical protein